MKKIKDVLLVTNILECRASFQITGLKIQYNPFAKAFLDAKERYLLFVLLLLLCCSFNFIDHFNVGLALY